MHILNLFRQIITIFIFTKENRQSNVFLLIVLLRKYPWLLCYFYHCKLGVFIGLSGKSLHSLYVSYMIYFIPFLSTLHFWLSNILNLFTKWHISSLFCACDPFSKSNKQSICVLQLVAWVR